MAQPENVLPPTHLRELASDMQNSEDTCDFNIVCRCRSKSFEIHYLGEYTRDPERGSDFLMELELNGGFAYRVVAQCSSCGKRHLVFDQWAHGWDGYQQQLECGLPTDDNYPLTKEQLAEPDGLRPPNGPIPNLTRLVCYGCSSSSRSIGVTIYADTFDDFIGEIADDDRYVGMNKKSLWSDMFGSIAMHMICDGCGTKFEAGFETA